MTFFDDRLPDRVSAGFQGGPEFHTGIAILANGDEFRNAEWAYPRHRYSAELGIFADDERDALLGAIWACAGAWGSFRFRDWNDYSVTGSALTVLAGTTTAVQLTKRYPAFGGTTAVRGITLPTSVTVYEDGVAVAGTWSGTTGLFTPTSNWGPGAITWSGEFDVRVRFANDYNPLTARHRKARVTQIDLIEVTA